VSYIFPLQDKRTQQQGISFPGYVHMHLKCNFGVMISSYSFKLKYTFQKHATVPWFCYTTCLYPLSRLSNNCIVWKWMLWNQGQETWKYQKFVQMLIYQAKLTPDFSDSRPTPGCSSRKLCEENTEPRIMLLGYLKCKHRINFFQEHRLNSSVTWHNIYI
jgi:hypothetical protein